MHFCFFWGTVILFFIGSVGLMLSERGILSISKDDAWFAGVNDFAGVMILFAVGVAMYRRLVLKERQLKTGVEDIFAIVLLAIIVLSGYGLEASRLIAQQVPGSSGWFSFVGYPLSLIMRNANLDWAIAETTFWWAHVVAGMGFVAYLPYGKMIHLIGTPLTVAANTAALRMGQRGPGM
jgi:nitrate reductase gamma subunit